MTSTLTHAEAAKKFLLNEPIDPEEGSFWVARSDEAGRRYFALQYAVTRGTMLSEVPKLFLIVVKCQDWREGWKWAGQNYDAPSLGEYVTRKPPHGLGATLKMAETWVRSDPEALAIFTEETTGQHGGNRSSSKIDNIKLEPRTGTSRAYTVARLRRERGDLFQQVLAGKLSVNRAADQAGWRTKPPVIKQIRKLLKRTTYEDRCQIRVMLDEMDGQNDAMQKTGT